MSCVQKGSDIYMILTCFGKDVQWNFLVCFLGTFPPSRYCNNPWSSCCALNTGQWLRNGWWCIHCENHIQYIFMPFITPLGLGMQLVLLKVQLPCSYQEGRGVMHSISATARQWAKGTGGPGLCVQAWLPRDLWWQHESFFAGWHKLPGRICNFWHVTRVIVGLGPMGLRGQ